MKNSVRNEARQAGMVAVLVAVAVLALFFFLSRTGLSSHGPAAGTAESQSSQAAPNPAAT